MTTSRYTRASALVAAAVAALLTGPVAAQGAPRPVPQATAQATPAAAWAFANDGRGARLSHSATAVLLDKAVPTTATFYCNPHSDRNSQGALGVDLLVGRVHELAGFTFDDFEGPDAKAASRKLVRLRLLRAQGPAQEWSVAVAGWYAQSDQFAFGLSAPSRQRVSVPRTVLAALAEGGESLQVSITDPRDPKRKLEWTIPVAGHAAEFKALLAGLN